MSRRSKQKGSSYEREFVQKVQDLGLPAHRVPLSGAMTGYKDDVVVCDEFRVECKYRKNAEGFGKLHDWLEVAIKAIVDQRVDAAIDEQLEFDLFTRPIGLHLPDSELVVYNLLGWTKLIRSRVDAQEPEAAVEVEPILVEKKAAPRKTLLKWFGEADALALRRPMKGGRKYPWLVCERLP